MFEYDIFVSYSSNDRHRALALAQGLRDAGLRVWLDDWVIGLGDDVVAVLHQLRAAHDLGIVHRDVTPANILLGIVPEPQRPERGRVVVNLIDFESACYARHAQTACGVFGYTPDEQMRGRAVPASDLFALLSSALFFATGKRPNASRWNQEERQRAAESIEWGDFTELAVIGHPFFASSWLDDPAQRPRDAAALLDRQDHRTKRYPPDTNLGVFAMPDGWRISMHMRRYVAERSR